MQHTTMAGLKIDELVPMSDKEQALRADPRKRMVVAAILPALAVLVLWLVHFLDRGLGLELHRAGVLPREWWGLTGVLVSPLVHGDMEHLFNNSIPVFVLGWALMYFYPRVAGPVVLGTWLLSGIWVWISARSNYHIGASGVVYGMAAFLFVSGVIRRQRTLMALALLVVFLYGSMVWGLFPIVPRVSWESHLWGAVAGMLMAWLYRGVPPAVQDPQPVQQDEPDEPDLDDPGSSPQPHPEASHGSPRIMYRVDPGKEFDGTGSSHGPADRSQPLDPRRTSGTWHDGGEQ